MSDTQAGRKVKARARQASQNQELNAEEQPRKQGRWLEEQRKATSLPKIGDPLKHSAGGLAGPQMDLGDIGAEHIGKKKARRAQVLAARKARKKEKKVAAVQKAHDKVADVLKSKTIAVKTPGKLKTSVWEALKLCYPRNPKNEQRLLASTAEKIASHPESHLELFDIFFELHFNGADERTKHMALLSAVAVFRDLVPNYRIRNPTDSEMAKQHSQEVLLLQKYEKEILIVYRRLLPALENGMKKQPLTFTAALCCLVKVAYDFNYRVRLIGICVKSICSVQESVRMQVTDALSEMVEEDARLEASKEVVLAIGNMAQAAAAAGGRGRQLQPELLQILLRLQVGRADDAEIHGLSQEDQVGMDLGTKRSIGESSIRHNVETLRKAETTLLYETFCVYLRLIRQRHVHSRELIASALGGLAKWGQHVNLELMMEIVKELKVTVADALTEADGLVALQGIHCALVLLAGPGQALLVDATWLPDSFTQTLEMVLPALSSTHSECKEWPPRKCFVLLEDEDTRQELFKASHVELERSMEKDSVPCLLLRCLDTAMKCSQGFGRASDSAMAGLLEGLFALAAMADSHVGLAIAREAAFVLKKTRRLHSLLDVDGGLFGLGGVVDRAISIHWPIQLLAVSQAPWPRRVGLGLEEAIKSSRSFLTELFPGRDANQWLSSEYPQHLGALLQAPKPVELATVAASGSEQSEKKKKRLRKKGKVAPFWSEEDLHRIGDEKKW